MPQNHQIQLFEEKKVRTVWDDQAEKLSVDGARLPTRVVWSGNKFIVLVGKWAEPIQEELSELLEKEFSLPYFEFVYDKHWDLRYGWL